MFGFQKDYMPEMEDGRVDPHRKLFEWRVARVSLKRGLRPGTVYNSDSGPSERAEVSEHA